jgi:RNA polymerase sigma-70 factor (ECF subfamily)
MDEQLVRRAQDGDPGAFRTLAIEQHPRLFAAAFGVLRDRDLAQDATQLTLVNVWRHFRSLRDPGRFEGWSYRILIHACYAEARRMPPLVADDGPAMREPVATDDFRRIDDRDQLERAFQRLSLEHRAVIVLHHLVDMPLEDVAEALELKIGTVKSRLHRAMGELRAAIEADARTVPTLPLGREVWR